MPAPTEPFRDDLLRVLDSIDEDTVAEGVTVLDEKYLRVLLKQVAYFIGREVGVMTDPVQRKHVLDFWWDDAVDGFTTGYEVGERARKLGG